MSSLTVSAPDDYATCPYDTTHRILWQRMPFHLIKCRKQHLLSPLQTCPFDTKHLVPQQEMPFHLSMCEAKVILGPDIVNSIAQESWQEKSEVCHQMPETSLPSFAEEETAIHTPSGSQGRRRLPCQLKMKKTLVQMETSDMNEKEEMWDDDLHQSGIVIKPFKLGQGCMNSDFTRYHHYSSRDNSVPLRPPLNVVQISESRQVKSTIVYSYAMNSLGIGRGAGRGKNITTCESRCGDNLSVSQVSSFGVGHARNKLFHEGKVKLDNRGRFC